MADSDYGAPQSGGGGIGGYFAENPWAKWVALGVVAAGAYYIYSRRRAAPAAVAGDGTTGTTSGTGAPFSYPMNPSTGLPVNPFTGQDFAQIGSASNDLGVWTSAALKQLQAGGTDPAVAEGAIYNFLNDLPLSVAQQGLISKALGSVGAAPGGPYPISIPPPTPAPAPAQGHYLNPVTWVWNRLAPATVAGGPGMFLNSLGVLGRDRITTPAAGNPIYAGIRNSKGQVIWTRISSLGQYTALGSGTQIATLKWTAPQPAVA